jgi:serine/threonine protein kinase
MGCCFSSVEGFDHGGKKKPRHPMALLGPPGGGSGPGADSKSNFDPNELDEDLARLYELKHPLGSGSAGETWLCRCRVTGELVAVKLMPRPLPGGMTTSIFREAKIGAQLGRGHLNIVKPRDLVLTRRHLGLVMEYVAGGNMADYILKALLLRHGTFDPVPGEAPRGLVLDEDEARYYFLQVVRAVDFCHRNAVVHRDLKMDNTLLDSSDPPRVKLCDFGFANWWPALGPGGGGGGAGGGLASRGPSAGLPPRPPPTMQQQQQQQYLDLASSLTTQQRQQHQQQAAGGNAREASATAASAASATAQQHYHQNRASSLRLPSNVATITGTPDYMSPQILSSKVHGRARGTYDAPKADVWACGVLLCVMLLGRFPFDGTNAVQKASSGGGLSSDEDDDDGGGGQGGGYHDDGGHHNHHHHHDQYNHHHTSPEEAAQRQEQDASMSVYLQQQAVLGQRAVKGGLAGGGGGVRRSGSFSSGGGGNRAPSLPESLSDDHHQHTSGATNATTGGAGSPSPCRAKRWFDHPALSGSAAFLTEGARDLLARIFEPDEDARISVKGILEHPWSTLPIPEPFHSALEQMGREQARIDGEVAAGKHASRDRDAALKQMVYAASQPFDPNVVSVGAAAVGASVHLGEDKDDVGVVGQHEQQQLQQQQAAAHAADDAADAAADPDKVRRVSLSAPPNPAEWSAAAAPRADPAEVARFFAMHSPDGMVSAEPSRHGGGDALGALGASGGGGGVGAR